MPRNFGLVDDNGGTELASQIVGAIGIAIDHHRKVGDLGFGDHPSMVRTHATGADDADPQLADCGLLDIAAVSPKRVPV